MATFDIVVDTSPMANSLDNVNSNVRNVTASVVAMESAVVVAQERASEHICQNVDNGFFILMKSQFDQKIAAVSSEMLSKMQLLDSFKEQIEKLMLVMKDDYERNEIRYKKLFSALDSALETRVHELDKYAYEISRNYKLSQFKTGSEVIKALCYSDDTQLLNVKEVGAIVKSKSARSISVMASDVIEQLEYSDSVKSILKNAKFETKEAQYIPVIFSESDSMMSKDAVVKNIYLPQEAKYAKDAKVLNQIKEKSESFEWNDVSDDSFEPVKNSFEAKISSEISDERVAKEMLRLFSESRWSEAGGNE
ncbi:MAG: hypothetical protein SPK10_01785 [Treponema sp.]|nr:hypothetical protein [Spirochaetia bacterium]MCI7109351.1 hypothetical protein [Spirochaetia bacterium]MDY3887142.1 hypothetical protein [Treponema sp.]MDY5763502.1 hypothetical protein [Treponema sp.]